MIQTKIASFMLAESKFHTDFLAMIAYRDEAQRLIKLERNVIQQQQMREFIDNINALIKECLTDIIDETN